MTNMSPEALKTRSGIELMRGMVSGDQPRAPIATLLDFAGGDIGEGWVEFSGTPDARH